MAVGMSLKLGSSAQVTSFVGNLNGGKVWDTVKQMLPAGDHGGLDPEPKIRSQTMKIAINLYSNCQS